MKVDLPVDANLPVEYLPGERLRLEAYRALASATTDEAVDAVRAELIDRYGPIPEPVENLLAVARFKVLCRRYGVTEVSLQGTSVRFTPLELPESAQLRLERLYDNAALQAGRVDGVGAAAQGCRQARRIVRRHEVRRRAAARRRSVELVRRGPGHGDGTLMDAVAYRWSGVTVDCASPRLVAEFWAALLGRELSVPLPGWLRLGTRGEAVPVINFQPVPEPKRGKTRIHLDIAVDDIDRGMAQVAQLGGRSLDKRYDYDEGIVVLMADPEGNEFCLVQYF